MNAFVLAFTSEYIPKLLYRMKYAPDRDSPGGATLTGYIDNSLASINLTYLFEQEPGTEPENVYENLNYTKGYCRYNGYFASTAPYKQNKQYWHVIAARLAFVFVFQFSVYLITGFIAYMVPDVPKDLDLKAKREKHLTKLAFKKKYDIDESNGDHHVLGDNEML